MILEDGELESSASYALSVVTRGCADIPIDHGEAVELLGEVIAELVQADVAVMVLKNGEKKAYRIQLSAQRKEVEGAKTDSAKPVERGVGPENGRRPDKKREKLVFHYSPGGSYYTPEEASTGTEAGEVPGLPGDGVPNHTDDAVDDRQRV